MLRTSEVESRATRASLTQLLSPQMGKDIVWFLRRWAKTYLLVDEKLYGQVREPPLLCKQNQEPSERDAHFSLKKPKNHHSPPLFLLRSAYP